MGALSKTMQWRLHNSARATAAGVQEVVSRDNLKMPANVQRAYLEVVAQAVAQVNSGMAGYEQATREAVLKLARRGVSVVDYKSGAWAQADVPCAATCAPRWYRQAAATRWSCLRRRGTTSCKPPRTAARARATPSGRAAFSVCRASPRNTRRSTARRATARSMACAARTANTTSASTWRASRCATSATPTAATRSARSDTRQSRSSASLSAAYAPPSARKRPWRPPGSITPRSACAWASCRSASAST